MCTCILNLSNFLEFSTINVLMIPSLANRDNIKVQISIKIIVTKKEATSNATLNTSITQKTSIT